MSYEPPTEPGWGKTIGAFFLYGMLTMAACIITSGIIVSNMGYSGYSNGGLASIVTGIACAAYYRSSGKFGAPAVVALIVGIVLGFVVVQISKSMAGI